MPTDAEFQELYDNCTYVWTKLNGVNGHLFTSNVNGNTLFFPAAGYYDGTSLSNRGSSGDYWSATYESATTARNLKFDISNVIPQSINSRRNGFTIRPVQDGTPNRTFVPQTSVNESTEEETPTTEEPKDDNQR